MKKTLSTLSLLTLLLLVFFLSTFASNHLLRGIGIDLTEDKIYSLSDGTKRILNDVVSPIELHYFFSDTTSKGLASLRTYAAQVESILKKYSELSDQKITLKVIDPQPFSAQEDKAAELGLSPAAVGPAQDAVYFGLAGTNEQGDTLIIDFFDPSKAAFLEYDISRLIFGLTQPERIKMTIVTDIALMGEQNPVTGEVTQPFAIYQQLNELFDVTVLANANEGLASDIDVLMLMHPQSLQRSTLYDIDQFLMNGGKAILFIDPHFESDMMAMMGSVGTNSSDLPLLSAYSVDVDLNTVVLDSQAGLEVRGPDGNAVRHFGFLGLGAGQINKDDVTTGDLDSVNGASFAAITSRNLAKISLEPLLMSTQNAALMLATEYSAINNPNALASGFLSADLRYILAARVSGGAHSYFSLEDPEVKEGFVGSTENLNMVVIGDADLVTDRFWVQQNRFFGQTMLTPFANNGDMIVNLVENYGGAQALIGLRGRGAFSRPFERVQAIAANAETAFREQENRLQTELQETEAQLAQLQSQQTDALTAGDEQQAIDAFVAKRIEIRKALRDVQFQLQKDINALGNQIKLINIVIAPILLTLLLFIAARLMRRRA